MQKNLFSVFGSILGLILLQTASAQFVSFNDHYSGAETHPYTTTWNVFGTANGAPGNSGLLKDIVTGANLPVTVTFTNVNAASATLMGKPAVGSPAYNVFNVPVNYIDWSNGVANAIQLPDSAGKAVMACVFTNLNPNKRYKFTGTGVRDGGYSDRFTLFELSGAASFTNAHTPGTLTGFSTGYSTNDIAVNQCVIQTGMNTEGNYACWNYIDPGADGSFAVLCSTYRGTIFGGSSAGTYAYGLSCFRLEEFEVAPTPVAITAHPQNQTVNEGDSVSFTVGAAGVPAPTLQWYRAASGVTNALTDATNSSYTLTGVTPNDSGAIFFVIAQNTVTNTSFSVTSSNAVLTVIPDTTPPALLSAVASSSLTNVTLTFSEAISLATATNKANYALTNYTTGQSMAVLKAAQINPNNVVLTTPALQNGAAYVVIVNGLRDVSAAANLIAPNTTLSFLAQSSYMVSSLGGATPAGTWTAVGLNGLDVSGGGTNIGGVSDSCQFIYQTRMGDFDVQVRVASQSLSDPWATAALMARPATPTVNNPFAAVAATPGMSGCYFLYRTSAGATAVPAGSFPVNYPYTWLRLQRTNSTSFIGYASVDGTTWAMLGSNSIALGDPVTIGFAVTSRSNGVANSVQFRDLGDTANPTSAGSVSLPVEPLGPCSRQTGLVISEIMYHPGNIPGVTNSLEFIEIFNSEPVPVVLTGHRLSGAIHYSFPDNTIMPAGSLLVVARDPGFLQTYYTNGLTGVLGPWYGNEELALSNNIAGNNLPNNGAIRLRNKMDAVLLEVSYDSKNPWPIAADGTGHSLVLARPSYGEKDVRAWAASDRIGGSPGAFDSITFDPLRNVVINEFLANSHTDPPIEDYIELYNHGNSPVNLGGAWLTDAADTNKFRISNGTTIGPRGFVGFTRSQLPFGLGTEGGRIYLVNSNATKVIDVVEYETQSRGVALGRSPDGAPAFRELSARTLGTNNAPVLLRDIVINEIMYNPITGGNDNQYVELYNKGTNSVDLLGWKFVHGISFTFSNSMIIPADGYVVVAKNKNNLKMNYGLSDAQVAGDFGGNLSHGGERIALAMPEDLIVTNNDNQLVTNRIHVIENEVTYGDAGRWGNWSDGGGSSLELVDPRSDNWQAANWADSDETAKSAWRSISITITNGIYSANSTNGGMPANYSPDNLHIYLLEAGEALVDEVKVVTESSVNLLGDAQGSFAAGVVLSNAGLALLNVNGGSFPSYFNTNWVGQGAYDQSTIDETGGVNNSRCLHLRGNSHGDPGPNKVRSPFFSANASGKMTIQAQARWLCGWPEIILRTHGGGYEVVGYLQPPGNLGTPGAPNSRRVANAGPAIWDVVHAPILPADNQPVVVTARAYDPDGPISLTLQYRINPGSAFLSLPMLDDGTGWDAVAGDGLYSANIPSQPSGTIVSFYIQAVDGLGATNLFPQDVFPKPGLERCFPNDSFTRECLIRWGDFNMPGSFATYHVWMTTDTVQRWRDREPRSNGSLDMTFAYNNCRVIYNGMVKSAGSPFHRPAQVGGPVSTTIVDYDVSVSADDPFLGETGLSMVVPGNVSGTDGTDKTALAEKMALLTSVETGVPAAHRRYVHAFVNGSQRSKISGRPGNFLEEDAARPNGAFLKTWFPDDSGGELIKLDDWFEFNDASTGFQNHNATITRRSVVMGGVEMLQTNKYRFQWQQRSAIGGSLNNWSNFMVLVNAFSPTLNDMAPVNLEAVSAHADMLQWSREIAMRHAAGDFDSWGYDRGKNNFLYRPTKGRYVFLPFDVDWSMAQSSRSSTEDIFKCGGPSLTDFNSGDMRGVAMYTNVAIRRIFLSSYKALIEGPYNNNFLNPIIDQYTAAFALNNIDYDPNGVNNMKTFIQQRRDFIATYLVGVTNPYSITTPPNIETNNNWITISGYAPVDVYDIKVNGVDYPIYWNTVNNWSIGLFVNSSVNTLQVQPYDRYGNVLSNLVANQVVTYTNPVPPMPGTIVFNEILYNPAVSNAAFVELFNISSNFTFDLSGWSINGLGNYRFPGGTYLTNRQFLILARDRAAFAAAYGSTVPVFDVFDGNLDLDGETLTLIKPALTTNETDMVVDKVRYEANAPWPRVAPGASIQVLDAGQDNARVGNWSSGAQWRFFTYTGNPGSPLPIYQYLYIYPDAPGCDLYLDDIRLVLGTNAGAGNNLVRNGDFETGTSTNWVVRSPGSVATNSVNHSGGYSFHMIVPSGAGGNPGSCGFSQVITNGFVANTNYTISYWYLSNFRGSNLYSQIVFSLPKFKGTNSSINAVPYSPAAANTIATTLPAFPPLWLNEVQPSNISTRANRFGQFTPWVELYNPSTNQVDLTGLYLANNYGTNLAQWAFPSNTMIDPGEFKVIWLDAAEANSIPTELHANFTIPESTGTVALVRFIQNGSALQSQFVDYLSYSGVGANLSYGDYPDGQPFKRQIFFRVTPGAANDAQPGVLKINEWMAINVSSSTNLLAGFPNPVGGGYDDWFEIYNPNDYSVNLSGYYLTDSTNNPTQYRIPNGYSVPANGFLLVWADNKPERNTNTRPDLHVNFNLGKDGEQIALYDVNSILVDLVVFGPQVENISQGRFADGGAAPFYFMVQPTPGSNNQLVVNSAPPRFDAVADQVVTNGRTLYVTNVAHDADAGQILSYHLGPSQPPGTTISSGSGLFTWRCWPTQPPGPYTISIWVQDNGYPRLSATNSFTVYVVTTNAPASNTPPVLGPISDQSVTVGQIISFTVSATDTDQPPQLLTFSLDPSAPAGANIISLDSTTGLFTWTPSAPTTNQITVRVTDNGIPPLSAMRTFTASAVANIPQPSLSIVQQDTAVEVSWPANSAGYILQYAGSLGVNPGTNWTTYTGPAFTNDAISVSFTITTNQYFRLFKP